MQRHIRKIHEPLPQGVGSASIFPNEADRFVWIDAPAAAKLANDPATGSLSRLGRQGQGYVFDLAGRTDHEPAPDRADADIIRS